MELVLMILCSTDWIAGPWLDDPEWVHSGAFVSAQETDVAQGIFCLLFLWWLASQRAKSHIAKE